MSAENFEILEEIDALDVASNIGQNRLLELSRHADEQVRNWALERMYEVDNPTVRERILEALHDEEELNRIAALEWIGRYEVKDFKSNVYDLANDSDPLVRAYVFSVLGVIGDRSDVDFIAGSIDRANDREKVSIYLALHSLGEATAINHILSFLSPQKHYHARIFTANMIRSELVDLDWPNVLQKLEENLRPDDPVSVVEAFERAIKWVKEEEL